ncbi:hypothetical protein PS718_02038 [Pseudomonas fluorescens]|uniref:Uncharacterized protein n=1 Tax=Pseudomonas fluorescens TaxID=294 RepID=A0A5E7BT58_PSEFL|nr:hypothetical protein [Pseudomonas fluorescens]VVN92897.1 hypothetical protein PS718_02038 [Pseudomonas fluorescens]
MNTDLKADDVSVVRGFIPVRLRSSRQTGARGLSGKTRWQVLGLLRSPSGRCDVSLNPLTTGDRIGTAECIVRHHQSSADPAGPAAMNTDLKADDVSVVRGFIPVRLRSSRKTGARGLSGKTRWQVLGLLRSPSGRCDVSLNPLTTGDRVATGVGGNAGPVGAAAGCDLLILIFSGIEKNQSKRSQPAAAPTGGRIATGEIIRVGEGMR